MHIIVFIQEVIWGEAGDSGHSHKTVTKTTYKCLPGYLFMFDLLSDILTQTNKDWSWRGEEKVDRKWWVELILYPEGEICKKGMSY